MPLSWKLASLVAVTAFVSAVAAVHVVRLLALRFGRLDIPGPRSAHRVPVPRLGGVGVMAGFGASTLLLLVTGAQPVPWNWPQMAAIGLTAGISLYDDLRGVHPAPRLLVHLLTALCIVLAGPAISGVTAVLAVLWIVGFINAFNFMDGIDGIAGLQATVAALTWVWLGVRAEQTPMIVAGLMMAGSCLGFLVHNWSPARIFLGDVGAAALGAILASMPWLTPAPGAWLLPAVCAVWPFWLDAGVTLVRRALRGERLWLPHQQHVYQQLVRSGYSHAQVALLYGVLAALGALAASAVTGTPVESLVLAR